MTVKVEKTEYNETLDFFIAICAFPVVSSTFGCMTEAEKKDLNARVKVLTVFLQDLMPKIQEREAENVRKNSDSGCET